VIFPNIYDATECAPEGSGLVTTRNFRGTQIQNTAKDFCKTTTREVCVKREGAVVNVPVFATGISYLQGMPSMINDRIFKTGEQRKIKQQMQQEKEEKDKAIINQLKRSITKLYEVAEALLNNQHINLSINCIVHEIFIAFVLPTIPKLVKNGVIVFDKSTFKNGGFIFSGLVQFFTTITPSLFGYNKNLINSNKIPYFVQTHFLDIIDLLKNESCDVDVKNMVLDAINLIEIGSISTIKEGLKTVLDNMLYTRKSCAYSIKTRKPMVVRDENFEIPPELKYDCPLPSARESSRGSRASGTSGGAARKKKSTK
jgi:hypothetical protein